MGTASLDSTGRPSISQVLAGLLRAAHLGPALAVTVLAAALATSTVTSPARIVVLTLAVLTGQLSIGWCNDLVDLRRDRTVGRTDKPVATGEVDPGLVRVACAGALVSTVVLSLACGPVAGSIHLLGVAAGWAYNLGLKSTAWSPAPYAVAFAALVTFVVLTEPGADPPAPWLPLAGALLGVGAHFVNVLPDLADDERTGVRGLPHRLGAAATTRAAVVVLLTASIVVALGARSLSPAVLAPAAVGVVALATVAMVAGGRSPFRAAIAIAAIDVVLLVLAP